MMRVGGGFEQYGFAGELTSYRSPETIETPTIIRPRVIALRVGYKF